jgi:hypothetical protein
MFIVGMRGEMPGDAYRGMPPISDVRPDWILIAYERNRDLILHFKPLPSLPEGPPICPESLMTTAKMITDGGIQPGEMLSSNRSALSRRIVWRR